MTTPWSALITIHWIAAAAQTCVEEKLPEKTGKTPNSNKDMVGIFLLTF
jgi:hypothetical protein